jgi:PIN domain nuclease of toxin-antitoxin system
MTDDPPGLLLDTNAWFWIVTGDTRVPPPVVSQVEHAAAAGRAHLSQISAWEIALKVSLGKLRINMPIQRWLEHNTEGLRLLDLPLDVVVDAVHLPGTFHKDPADRFIVASARHHRLRLVTGDALILEYAKSGHVDVLAA